MRKKAIIYLVLFVTIILGMSVFAYLYSSRAVFIIWGKPISYPEKESRIHLYDNAEKSANQVLVRVYYNLPSDRQDLALVNWQKKISDITNEVSQFYQMQFNYEMELSFEIYPEVIQLTTSTNHFISLLKQDYQSELDKPHSESEAIQALISETEEKVSTDQKWQIDNNQTEQAYVINLFVLGLDIADLLDQQVPIIGLNDEHNNSLVFSSGFFNDAHNKYYGSVVAQEIGHSLGIPDFYSYTSSEIQSTGIMGAGFFKPIKDNYLENKIKKKMID